MRTILSLRVQRFRVKQYVITGNWWNVFLTELWYVFGSLNSVMNCVFVYRCVGGRGRLYRFTYMLFSSARSQCSRFHLYWIYSDVGLLGSSAIMVSSDLNVKQRYSTSKIFLMVMSVTPRYARMSNYGHPCSNFNKQANTAILNALIQSEAFQFLIEHTLMSLVI